MHVGSEDNKKFWHLPEKLLKSKSQFFTAALEDGFAEGILKSVTLPEEDPDIFAYFVEWLYVGHDQSAAFEADFHVRWWALGDRLACPLMQDEAMWSIVDDWSEGHIHEEILPMIYELSAPGSKIRQFAIDHCLFDIREICKDGHQDGCSCLKFAKINQDFAQQLAEETILLGNRKPNNPSYNPNPYLYAPAPYTSKPSSSSNSPSEIGGEGPVINEVFRIYNL